MKNLAKNFCLFIILCISTDLYISRYFYNKKIKKEIHPLIERGIKYIGNRSHCEFNEVTVKNRDYDNCTYICMLASIASEKRIQIKEEIRESYFFGKNLAIFYDFLRKNEKVYNPKYVPCQSLLIKSEKSNKFVNYFCLYVCSFATIFLVLYFVYIFANKFILNQKKKEE